MEEAGVQINGPSLLSTLDPETNQRLDSNLIHRNLKYKAVASVLKEQAMCSGKSVASSMSERREVMRAIVGVSGEDKR